MNITVRRAERADAETLMRLIRALAEFEELPPPAPDAEQRLVEDGWPESGNPRFHAWIAEADGTTAAYAITFFTYSSFLAHPTLYLEDLFVLPEFRRAGVATKMMSRLHDEAVETGCGRMEWVVLDWNENAQRFYEGLGAKRLHEWQTYRLLPRTIQS